MAESIRDGIKARRRKQVAQARAEGRAEGRAEAYVAWEDWNRRRVEAEATGETFNETPPSLNGEQPE